MTEFLQSVLFRTDEILLRGTLLELYWNSIRLTHLAARQLTTFK